MASEDSERRPLLAGHGDTLSENRGSINDASPSPSAPPPPYTPQPIAGSSSGDAATLPVGADELPPPYTPTPQGGIPMINCKVCQAIISLEGKQHLFVVKCNVCSEATPIRAAPPGKKYIRCPCNLLLVCRSGATKILCPKDTCKRVIMLPGVVDNANMVPGVNRYTCAICSQIFVIRTFVKFARCPHCRRQTCLGQNYARTRGHIYMLIGLLFLAGATGVTVGTFELNGHGVYVAWIGGFVVGILFIIRALLLYCVRVSLPLQPAHNV